MKRVSKFINFRVTWYAIACNRIIKGQLLTDIDINNNTCFIISSKGEHFYNVSLTDLYNTYGEAKLMLKEEQK